MVKCILILARRSAIYTRTRACYLSIDEFVLTSTATYSPSCEDDLVVSIESDSFFLLFVRGG